MEVWPRLHSVNDPTIELCLSGKKVKLWIVCSTATYLLLIFSLTCKRRPVLDPGPLTRVRWMNCSPCEVTPRNINPYVSCFLSDQRRGAGVRPGPFLYTKALQLWPGEGLHPTWTHSGQVGQSTVPFSLLYLRVTTFELLMLLHHCTIVVFIVSVAMTIK